MRYESYIYHSCLTLCLLPFFLLVQIKPKSLEEATYSAQEADMLGLIYYSAVNREQNTQPRFRCRAISDFGDSFISHIKDQRVSLRTCPDKIIYFRRMANFFMKQFDLTTAPRCNKKKKRRLQSSGTEARGAPITSPQKRRDAQMETMGIFWLINCLEY